METKKATASIICSVRNADDDTRKKLVSYKQKLLSQGYAKVYLPHLDTDQKASGYEICMQNMQAILKADEIHIFFSPASYGSHFDLGVTFIACHLYPKKIIKVIENGQMIDAHGQFKLLFEKSFGQMLCDWENKQNEKLITSKKN